VWSGEMRRKCDDDDGHFSFFSFSNQTEGRKKMVPVGLEKRTNFFFVFLFWLYFSLSLFITCIYLLYVIYTSPAYLCVCVCQRDSPAAVVCVWLFYPGWAVWFVPCRRSHKKTTRGGGNGRWVVAFGF
jgi:hypothetical protein